MNDTSNAVVLMQANKHVNDNNGNYSKLAKYVQDSPADVKGIREAALNVLIGHGLQAGLYFELACEVRKSGLDVKVLRAELLEFGFTKSRVSEIIKVGKLPEADWCEYEGRRIGWKKALGYNKLTQPLVNAKEPELLEVEQADTPKQKRTKKVRMEIAGHVLAMLAEKFKYKDWAWTDKNGYEISIKAPKAPKAKSEVA